MRLTRLEVVVKSVKSEIVDDFWNQREGYVVRYELDCKLVDRSGATVLEGQLSGIGFDAAMMRDAPEKLKRRVGWPAYVVSGARHLRGRIIRVKITVDGGETLHRRVRTVVVGNVGRLQAGIPLLPDAEPDDGILDVIVIAPRGLLDWGRVADRVLTRRSRPDRRMERYRGRHVVDPRTRRPHGNPRQRERANVHVADGTPTLAGSARGRAFGHTLSTWRMRRSGLDAGRS